ncbi:MAG: HNH endonuclease [Ideonella sp.]|nr:HNH endonuclease [Ideonella sp.]
MTSDPQSPTATTHFNVGHNEAFRALGALEPGQQWSAFDVPRDQARAGKASRFVTTIWNFHSSLDERGRRTPTEKAICKDTVDGTLWYRVAKPPPRATRKTWTAHWAGIQLALERGLPMVGVLKDVYTRRCSLEHVFDIASPRYQVDDGSLWLQLRPRADVGCDVRPVDIRVIAGEQPSAESLLTLGADFEHAVTAASQLTSSSRAERLNLAPVLPRRIEVVTTVFVRNPDVVAEVLLQAKGHCQRCMQPAPFTRASDGTPYLEVHHRVPLAIGGEDTVANAIALCPNCHRAAHYA